MSISWYKIISSFFKSYFEQISRYPKFYEHYYIHQNWLIGYHCFIFNVFIQL